MFCIFNCVIQNWIYKLDVNSENCMIMIDVLRPLLCTKWAKWAEQPPKVMNEVKAETTFRYENCMKVAGNTILVCQEFIDKKIQY